MEVIAAFPLRGKTTMRIGGSAKYFAELTTREDAEKAMYFAREHELPLVLIGNGSNTVFSDTEIQAFVVQVKHEAVTIDGVRVTVGAGKNLPMLINELAEKGMDLSALTGIPGTVGGAVFGNAGQGPKGVWIDRFVQSVTVLEDGHWKTLPREDCGFAYRESGFKHAAVPVILYEIELTVPIGSPPVIKTAIQTLLQKRIETQPHLKTAGSCFKAAGDVPAWKLIDAAGLRGLKIGGVEISPKHANFLMNTGEATYDDAVAVVQKVRSVVTEKLDVEMRFVETDGSLKF